tara:strand:+ start:1913 stop:2236 length:324 start_codon:yes stop_codon:yes gene_type:complete
MTIKLKRTSLLVSIIGSAALLASLSFSSSAGDHEKVRDLVQSGNILPLETILERLKEKSSGRVIEVELEHKQGRLIYEIEQIDEHGVVREYDFDAANGELIKEKVEH